MSFIAEDFSGDVFKDEDGNDINISLDETTILGIAEWPNGQAQPTLCYYSRGLKKFIKFNAKYFKVVTTNRNSDIHSTLIFYERYSPYKHRGICSHVIYFRYKDVEVHQSRKHLPTSELLDVFVEILGQLNLKNIKE